MVVYLLKKYFSTQAAKSSAYYALCECALKLTDFLLAHRLENCDWLIIELNRKLANY